jgi:5-methylcytosine-specific restriction endonuclease McrA
VNKTQVKKLLVAERKSMREKAKNSAFMRKTLSVYNGMKKRAGCDLDFTLERFRETVWLIVGAGHCAYCGCRLTVSNLAIDHATPIARGGTFHFQNLVAACKSCNWQKGILTAEEFTKLLVAVACFNKEAQADIKRRLTIGGKWGVRA